MKTTNLMTLALLEKAKVIGRIELPDNLKRPQKSPDFITKADLDALEKVLDRLFAHYKIDIEFSKHFKDQVNLSRNKKQITIDELSKMFRKVYTKFGSKLTKMKDREAVLVDLQSKINVPFVLIHNKNGDIDLVSKTVMRKPNFKTSNQKLKVEGIHSFASFIKLNEANSK